MNSVFLDTSGLIACVNRSDQWNASARPAWVQLIKEGRTLVTTSLVLFEIGDGLSRVQLRSLAIQLRKRLLAASNVQILSVTDDQETRAWEMYAARQDKEWGMTDCVSMIVMQDAGIQDVFTLDHHFEQAGFHPLITA